MKVLKKHRRECGQPPVLVSRNFSAPPKLVIKKPETLQSQAFSLVRSMGLEPIRLPIRPSNVRVCQFRHDRAHGLGLGRNRLPGGSARQAQAIIIIGL